MALSFFDPKSGGLREFKPKAAPAVGTRGGTAAATDPTALRERELLSRLNDALLFLGFAPAHGGEILIGGGGDPGPGAVRLSVAPAAGDADWSALAARGFAPEDFSYLCLKTHYRKPMSFSWGDLQAARSERAQLLAAAKSFGDAGLEPSSRGRAGYLHRFREALSRDLDLPEALNCVWDGLKPGALSPGSKGALLAEALPALGLKP